jgi:hypothetical protein
MPDIIKENLHNMGIETVDAPPCKTLNSELAYHPDIVLNNPKIGINRLDRIRKRFHCLLVFGVWDMVRERSVGV